MLPNMAKSIELNPKYYLWPHVFFSLAKKISKTNRQKQLQENNLLMYELFGKGELKSTKKNLNLILNGKVLLNSI